MANPRNWDKRRRPHRRLEVGMRGEDCKAAQQAANTTLKQAGSRHQLVVDGIWGRRSERLFGYACHHRGLAHRKATVAQQRLVRWPWLRTPAQKRLAQARRPKRRLDGQLSAHFHVDEFRCRDGTPVPDYMIPHLRRWCQVYGEPLRAQFGPCIITSGYRTEPYNARIGGEDRSFHVYPLRKSQPAADLVFGRGKPSAWGAAAKALRAVRNAGNGGIGIYPDFIHCDTRNYPANW